MCNRIFGASGTLRIAFGLVIVGVASGAFAQLNIRSMPPTLLQVSKRHDPGPARHFSPSQQIDTLSFFPQIDTTIGQRGFRRRPGEKDGSLAIGAPNSTPFGGVGGTSRSVLGPTFPGIGFTGWIPPDCSAAVGTSHIVQTVNSSIAFYDKSTGNVQFSQASTQFFAGLGATSFQFDPRVMYDQYNDRFVIIFLALDEANEVSQMLIAASDDGNPNGLWNRFVFDSSVDDGIANSWLDYHGVGFSPNSIVVSGNMFQFGAGFTAMQSWVFQSAPIYNNTGATAVPFTVTGLGFNTRPGVTYTPGTTTVYGISLNTNSSVRLWAYTGLDTATPALTSVVMPVQQYSNVGAAPSGGAGVLDSLSGRTMDAVSRGNSFLGAHTIVVPGDNKASIRWYEFDMGSWPTSGTPTLSQQGNITLGAGQWAIMPAISKNSFGDISVIYTRSSNSIFSDLVTSSRVQSDPAGTIGGPTLIRGGLTSSQMGRWGDYFSMSIDPSDDATFWGHGEVVRADGLWATEIQSWTVSSGGGGGGGVDYDAISLTSFMGTYNAGGLAEATTSDNLTFDVDSILLPGQGHFGAVQADFLIAEPGAGVTELNVKVETNVDPGVSATGTVFLWNWNQNRFEYGKAFPVRRLGNDIQSVKLKTSLAKYVSGTGQVRVVIRAHDPFRFRGTSPSPFRLRTDLVKLTVKS